MRIGYARVSFSTANCQPPSTPVFCGDPADSKGDTHHIAATALNPRNASSIL